jgi:hypothetical protein
MNYDYEKEFRRTGEGFEKVMILVGENDAAVRPPEMLRSGGGIRGRSMLL